MLTYTASEARAKLPEIIDLVIDGEEVSITRHGKPVVVVVSPEMLRVRRPAAVAAMVRAREIGRRIEDAQHRPLSEPTMTQEYAEELIAEIRAGRDALMDAFDADVLIYASLPDDPLGGRVRALFSAAPPGEKVGFGSVLLLPEVLPKVVRDGREAEHEVLDEYLGRLKLVPLDWGLAQLATELATAYRLKAVDAAHLATAVFTGADRFITNNQRDFPKTIEEIDVVYPADLPDPEETDHG